MHISGVFEQVLLLGFNQRILEDMDSLRILSVPAGFVVEPTLVPEGAQVVVRPQV